MTLINHFQKRAEREREREEGGSFGGTKRAASVVAAAWKDHGKGFYGTVEREFEDAFEGIT